jgi:Icc-related predicted phosphoesterase
MTTAKEMVRIAAVADLHFSKNSPGTFQPMFAQLSDIADILVLCGDLTDLGHPDEARLLARELAMVKVPMIGVLGNHDYHTGKQDEVSQILSDSGLKILDGDSAEIHHVGFAGTKGFAGGFDNYVLAAWGEESIKRFVHEAIDEALKLESALAKLRTAQKIALLHYAPIRATVEGEPLEIFPYLGSSRLEEPLNRYSVSAVFHGHAHHGALEGRTRSKVPVYNVSLPLLRKSFPDRPPFYILTVPAIPPVPDVAAVLPS